VTDQPAAGQAGADGQAGAAGADEWRRLSPLSPLVQAGRLVAGLLSLFVVTVAQDPHGGDKARLPELVVVALLAIGAVIKWLVTRWRLDGSTLRIETGLLRRDSKQLPVSRIQAVDVVRPFLARVLGLAELRIRLAGSSSRDDGRLAYLTEQEAASVRAMLLAAHHGLDPSTPEPGEQPVSQVPAGRLIASALLWAAIRFAALVVVVVIVAVTAPHVFLGLISTLCVYAFGLATAAWRRISSCFGFTVAVSPDGIRIRRGLLGTVAETIPVHQVQAVRMTQPLLWRPFGWCRLQVDVAGVAGGDEGSHEVRKDLLPVGPVAEAEYLVRLVLRHEAPVAARPPRRARVKAPLSYHFLAAGHDEIMAVASTGRVTKTTVWLRLEKLQSVRLVQGPLQRALDLATVHGDAAGRHVHVIFRDRPAREAPELLDQLAALSRTQRNVSAIRQYGENGRHGSATLPGS
jgi:putative membrane protein